MNLELKTPLRERDWSRVATPIEFVLWALEAFDVDDDTKKGVSRLELSQEDYELLNNTIPCGSTCKSVLELMSQIGMLLSRDNYFEIIVSSDGRTRVL